MKNIAVGAGVSVFVLWAFWGLCNFFYHMFNATPLGPFAGYDVDFYHWGLYDWISVLPWLVTAGAIIIAIFSLIGENVRDNSK